MVLGALLCGEPGLRRARSDLGCSDELSDVTAVCDDDGLWLGVGSLAGITGELGTDLLANS